MQNPISDLGESTVLNSQLRSSGCPGADEGWQPHGV